MEKYDSQKIEAKWQKIWQETSLYSSTKNPKKKFYCLVMFAYPSGDLHIGHWYNFAPADTIARFKKMQGFDVLEPIGFDAFGLPAENAAIKRGLKADRWTDENIANMTKQLKSMGAMYDWDKLITTSSADYYKWTQWLFIKLFKNKLAYQKKGLVNWCPSCQTVLANEQVIHGECERCNSKVKRKNLKQWYFKITDYADSLLDGLEKIDWPEDVKQMQRNWIGKSYGARIDFPISENQKLEVFTTRVDTIFGATFMVIAPEHPLALAITQDAHRQQVEDYIKQAGSKTDVDRLEQTEKTGVFTGSYVLNPATKEQIPIWISDYVLMGYGTGAIMAVPAHDERDFEFAKKFGLEIRQVISGKKLPHTTDGKLVNSAQFNDMSTDEAKKKITSWLKEIKVGKNVVEYKLRDWLISRQRYWGAPIPIIYCDKCGVQTVEEKDLPVILPLNQKIKETGRSPLLDNADFVNTKCPKCSGSALRETDTMDTFVDSSWYYLRYPNPHYRDAICDPVATKKWLPVDLYIGGREHAVMHLLYARFINQFLFDQKIVYSREPFSRLINQGTILGPDGNKMSKSKGNVVDPDDYVKKYGADAVRLYLMFMGPYEEGGPWDPKRFEGTHRFIGKIWDLFNIKYQMKAYDGPKEMEIVRLLDKTVKKVGEDLEKIKFNTAIAAMMEFINMLSKSILEGFMSAEQFRGIKNKFALILSPFAPYLSEELWELNGNVDSVHKQLWPVFDKKLIKDDLAKIIIQINGKLRGEIVLNTELSPAKIEQEVRQLVKQKKLLQDEEIIKVIIVPGKLANLVTKSKK